MVNPGGTANTYGSWVEFSSALPQNIKAFMFTIGMRGDHLLTTNTHWTFQVGVGASGSEQVIIDEWHTGGENENDALYPKVSPLFNMNIPSGERLAVRCKCTVTTTDRYKDVAIYAFA